MLTVKKYQMKNVSKKMKLGHQVINPVIMDLVLFGVHPTGRRVLLLVEVVLDIVTSNAFIATKSSTHHYARKHKSQNALNPVPYLPVLFGISSLGHLVR